MAVRIEFMFIIFYSLMDTRSISKNPIVGKISFFISFVFQLEIICFVFFFFIFVNQTSNGNKKVNSYAFLRKKILLTDESLL